MSSIEAPILEEAPRQSSDNFRSVLNVVTERWMLLLAGMAIGACLFGGLTWLGQEVAPTRYRASANLFVKPAQYTLISPLAGPSDLAMTAGEILKRTSTTELAEEVARAIIQQDIARGGPHSDVTAPEEFQREAGRIHDKISLTAPIGDGEQLEILAQYCDTAREAEDIAEFATRVFLDMNRQTHETEARERHEFLKRHMRELRASLAEAEEARLIFQQKNGFRTFDGADKELAAIEESLKEIEAGRETIRQKLLELASELEQASNQFSESLNQPSDNMVNSLFDDLDTLLEEKMALSAVYQPSWPPLVELEERIAETQALILEAERQKETGIPGGSDIWVKRKNIYQQQIDLRLQLTGLEIKASALRKQREELIPQVPELANLKLDADRLQREVDNVEQRLNDAADRELELRANIEHGLGSVERAASAAIVGIPMSGRDGGGEQWVNFMIGGLVGLVLAFGLAMAIEYNDTSIRSIEDVNEHIGLEVIGTIPRMRFGRPRGGRRRRATYVSTVDEEQIDACIVTQHDPKSPISEAYRTLRTNFQFATIKKKPRTVMVTSAVPGEGKTTTAANLAVTMADRGIRVLIVDTDLRRPNVHRVLRMERGPGLADVLREGLEPKSVIRPTRIENLWIISSGRVPPNPSELIGSEHMARLMAQLGDEFDLVICDAPSVLVVTDPVLLATHVDTCIMVVSTNNARRETVIRARKLLSTANVTVAGVVVNGLETTRRHYYYYYYYYDEGSSGRRKWYHL